MALLGLDAPLWLRQLGVPTGTASLAPAPAQGHGRVAAGQLCPSLLGILGKAGVAPQAVSHSDGTWMLQRSKAGYT